MSRIAQLKTVEHPLKESLVNYYHSNKLDLTPVTNLKFRHFRLRLLDGTFHKVKQKIRTPQNLQKIIEDYTPLDVYYSTATWLNPHIIAGRLDKDILKNIYISCDLSFDIDISNQIKTLVEAKTQTLNLSDFLTTRGIRIRYYAFSGSKGFHIVCDDPWTSEESEAEPLKRELKAIERRKNLVHEASEEELLFDQKVTIDTRRIIRLPGTINSKTGLACTTLTKSQLESDMETILKSATREEITTPRIPNGEMTAPSANKTSGSPGRLGVRPRPEDYLCYSLFYTSNIPGTQLKIPILEFESWTPKNRLIQTIERAQQQYNLGTIYLFGDDEKYWAASLKALPRRRIEKILTSIGSTNINQSKKYGCTYTRIGKSIGVDGETIQSEPKLLKIIESDMKGQTSRTHHEFYESLGITIQEKAEIFCGDSLNKLELIHAVIE
jgi:DNA primase catalytic subunit